MNIQGLVDGETGCSTDMKLVSGYKHTIGSHCSSTLMSDILCNNGIYLSEDMCFGLGAGLGFLYRKCWSPAYYMVLGRGHDIEEKITSHLGLFADINISYNDKFAWEEVKALVDSDCPVIVDVDAALLPYMKRRFDLFDYVRYGGHKACLVGYDDKTRQVALYDYAWHDLQLLSFEDFASARNSDSGEFPSCNMWINIGFPKKSNNIEDGIFRAIGYNVHTMKYPVTNQTGLHGLEKFLRQVMYWPLEKDKEHVKKNAYIAYMMLETVGTGGGNFRRMYSRFLKESAEIAGVPKLNDISGSYGHLAHNWTKIAKLLKASSMDIELGIFKDTQSNENLLTETFQMETDMVNQLQDVVKQYSAIPYLFL